MIDPADLIAETETDENVTAEEAAEAARVVRTLIRVRRLRGISVDAESVRRDATDRVAERTAKRAPRGFEVVGHDPFGIGQQIAAERARAEVVVGPGSIDDPFDPLADERTLAPKRRRASDAETAAVANAAEPVDLTVREPARNARRRAAA